MLPPNRAAGSTCAPASDAPSAPCPGFLPSDSSRESTWMSHTQGSSDILPHSQTTSDHRKWCFVSSNISEGSNGCPRDRRWREKMPFLGREHSSLLSVPHSLGDPGPSVLTCPVRAPPSCSMDATHCLDPEPSGLITPPFGGSSTPMVTMRRQPHGHRGALYPGWSVGMCPASLTTTLHLLLCPLGRTVGRG